MGNSITVSMYLSINIKVLKLNVNKIDEFNENVYTT